jgi:hypothetical protein
LGWKGLIIIIIIIIAIIKIIIVTTSFYDLFQVQRLKLSHPPPLHSAPNPCPKIYVDKAAVGFGFQAFLFKYCRSFILIGLFYCTDMLFTVWGRRDMQTGLKWVNLKDGDHLEFLGLRCRILLEQILSKCDEMAWIGFI